jgi:hypothetical protein
MRKPPRIPINSLIPYPSQTQLTRLSMIACAVTAFWDQCHLGESYSSDTRWQFTSLTVSLRRQRSPSQRQISESSSLHKNQSRCSTRQTAVTYKPYSCPQESSTRQPRPHHNMTSFHIPHYGPVVISHSQREFSYMMQLNMAAAWLTHV